MNRSLAAALRLSFVASLGCHVLGCLVLGCTVETGTMLPDAGMPEPMDAGMDAGSDGGHIPIPTVDTCTPERMDSTLGASCTEAAECDDGCHCNGHERCTGGTCAAGTDPCADEVECTADVCLEEIDRCFHDPRHAMCMDGDACNGLELCDLAVGCTTGPPPYCNDETSCTLDSCDVEMGCVYTPRDLDGDGYTDGRCGGEDCDDDPRFGTNIFPEAPEDCMNRRDDDCDGRRDYNDPEDCMATNDRCELAVVLPGAGTFSGSTVGLAPSYALSCRASGRDAVFRFTLGEPHDVQVTVAGGGTGVGVALRSFAQCEAGPDEKCIAGTSPTILRRSLPAGEWAILVQSTGEGAPFDLTLRINPPTEIPPIDVCDATTQDLCGGAPCTTLMAARFTGLFVETEDDYEPSCASGADRRDAVYQFTLDAPKDVTLSASSSGASSSTTTYLSLTSNCATQGGELRCIQGSPSMMRHRELPAGTYYVIIESYDSTPMSWTLDVTITDPVTPRTTGDSCSMPIDISEATLGGGGSGMVSVSALELDSSTVCDTSRAGRDATFFFTLPSTRDVTVTATVSSSASNTASVLSACGRNDTSSRCWNWYGTGASAQSWRSLAAGTYWFTVATNSGSGEIHAEIFTQAPTAVPPNDRCEGAIELVPGVLRRDTTIGFSDDAAGGSCAPTREPDAFYTITLGARTPLVVVVTDADEGTTPFHLTLRAGDPCMSTAMPLACQISSTTPPSSAVISTTLDPGVYHLIVETPVADMSDFEIRLATF